MSRKSKPYRDSQSPSPVPSLPVEPCHRCNGTGIIVRYRIDSSVKSEAICPCHKKGGKK